MAYEKNVSGFKMKNDNKISYTRITTDSGEIGKWSQVNCLFRHVRQSLVITTMMRTRTNKSELAHYPIFNNTISCGVHDGVPFRRIQLWLSQCNNWPGRKWKLYVQQTRSLGVPINNIRNWIWYTIWLPDCWGMEWCVLVRRIK